MTSRLAYHLVDRLVGVNGSRRYIKTFGSFNELKEFIVSNRVELYKAIPEPVNNAPDYSSVRGFKELVDKLESNEYMGWHLTAIQTVNVESTVVRLKGNNRWNYTEEMLKGSRRRGLTYKSGVSESYLEMLDRKEQNMIKDSSLFRVLHTKRSAILVEWMSPKGSFTKWIPSHYLK